MADNFIEAHFRAAVESAPSGLLMSDAEGRIVLVNREIERLFGYAREELLGQPVEKLVPMRSRAGHPASRAMFRQDPRVRAMGAGRDLNGIRKDGTEVPIEIGLTPLATEAGLFVLAAVVDISERKRLEREQRALNEQLRQSQKLEAIGTLAGGIAHDFNNILGGIIGYAELLRDQLPADSAEVRDVEEILAAAMRGSRLVDRIQTFSRRQDSARVPVDLRELVREVHQLLRPTLPAAISLRVTVPDALPRILADATSVHQVLMNLGSNAAQAMPAGGTLEFSVEPFLVGEVLAREHPELREGAYLALDVRDDGIGMDDVTRARAFEPFFTTKPAGSGTGLGLAMVHGIMTDHGGAVLLESERGRGTRVRCLFPVPAGVSSGSPRGATLAPALRGHGERLLLVDDEPGLLEATGRRLTALGYRVRTCDRPSAALELMREDPSRFDLMITDLSMPEMTGADLAESIRRLRADLPIILLSGYVDHVSGTRLRDAGIGFVLQKPAILAELARTCRLALGDEILDGRAVGGRDGQA